MAADVQSATTTPTSPSYEELTTTYANGDAGDIVGVGKITGTTQTEYRLTVPTGSNSTTTTESITLPGSAGLETVVDVSTKQGNTTTENITTTLPDGTITTKTETQVEAGSTRPSSTHRSIRPEWVFRPQRARSSRAARRRSRTRRSPPPRQGLSLSPGRRPIQSARIERDQHDHRAQWRGHQPGEVDHDHYTAPAAGELRRDQSPPGPPPPPGFRDGDSCGGNACPVVYGEAIASTDRSPATSRPAQEVDPDSPSIPRKGAKHDDAISWIGCRIRPGITVSLIFWLDSDDAVVERGRQDLELRLPRTPCARSRPPARHRFPTAPFVDILNAGTPVSETTTTTYSDGTTQTADLLLSFPNTERRHRHDHQGHQSGRWRNGEGRGCCDRVRVIRPGTLSRRPCPTARFRPRTRPTSPRGYRRPSRGQSPCPAEAPRPSPARTVQNGSKSVTVETITNPAGQVYHDRIVITHNGTLSQSETNTTARSWRLESRR